MNAHARDLDEERRRLGQGVPPDWASEWGEDRHGVFVGFALGDASMRMRWIPSGRFLMGSPEDEEGRFENEGLRHEVTISKGFWLFDTACTQGLWQAVMGGNPSRFKSDDRPVENVSWNDAREFMGRINDRIPGLDLCLPSEAQWEYACRAGTPGATYAGNLKILGQNNAPQLDAIAWYGGNSGEGFDLEDGYDSSDWSEKQYPHTKAGTRPVRLKKSNPWGLYDMLGNVLEWCADGMRVYDGAAQRDPLGATESAAGRVLRGGSWFNSARGVRSASRDASDPGDRAGIVGFRCARVQD